jgi:hypothetical protein
VKIFGYRNKAVTRSISSLSVEDWITRALLTFIQIAGVQGKAVEDPSH